MTKKTKRKLGKEELRRIWILNALSDCEKWSQDDIKKLWYLMSKAHFVRIKTMAKKGIYFTEFSERKAIEKTKKDFPDYDIDPIKNFIKPVKKNVISEEELEEIRKTHFSHRRSETLKEINKNKPKPFKKFAYGIKGSINLIFKEFSKEDGKKIVEKNTGKKKQVPKHEQEDTPVYSLVQDYDTLYYILNEINNPLVPSHFKDTIIRDLMRSKYFNEIVNDETINKEFIPELESYLTISLETKDKDLIRFCLKNSPTVLYNTLRKMTTKRQIPVFSPEKEKNSFIMKIKNWAYEDKGPYGLNGNKITFEMTVKVKTREESFTHTNADEIRDPEEEKFMKEYFEASWEGVMLALTNKELPESITDEKTTIKDDKVIVINDETKKRLINSQKIEGYYSVQSSQKKIQDIKEEIGDETGKVCFKHDGKKIDIKKWLSPPFPDNAPY